MKPPRCYACGAESTLYTPARGFCSVHLNPSAAGSTWEPPPRCIVCPEPAVLVQVTEPGAAWCNLHRPLLELTAS